MLTAIIQCNHRKHRPWRAVPEKTPREHIPQVFRLHRLNLVCRIRFPMNYGRARTHNILEGKGQLTLSPTNWEMLKQ